MDKSLKQGGWEASLAEREQEGLGTVRSTDEMQ